MSKIFDLQAEKDKRTLEALLKEKVGDFEGFAHDIVLYDKNAVFEGHVIGNAQDAQFTIIVCGQEPDSGARQLGAIRFKAEQLRKMILLGFRMLNQHKNALEK